MGINPDSGTADLQTVPWPYTVVAARLGSHMQIADCPTCITQTLHGSRAFNSTVYPVYKNKLQITVLEGNLPVFRRRLKSHLFTVA